MRYRKQGTSIWGGLEVMSVLVGLLLVACGAEPTATSIPTTLPATIANTATPATTATSTTLPATTTPPTTTTAPASPTPNPQPLTPTPEAVLPVATPIVAGPPAWFKDVPAYDKLQKLELDDEALKGLGLPRAQFYVSANLSPDPVTTIVDFYSKKLEAAGWKTVQKLPLRKEEAGQQLTFNRAQSQGAPQVLILLVSNGDNLKNYPTTAKISPKVPAGQNLVLLIASADKQPQVPVTPPTTNLPAGIAAENLTFDFGDGWKAQGQITYPAGQSGPFPTVILVHGSGANDMDETLPEDYSGVPGGSKVFRQIAYALPLRGFAVVRYNRRGVIGIGPQISDDPQAVGNVTHSKLTQDAALVLKETLKNPKVDPQRVIMLGHSEGTLNVSTLVTSPEGQQVAGIILIGVQGYDIKSVLQYQLVDRIVLQLQACDSNKDSKLSVEEFLPCPQPYSPIPPEAVSGFLEPDTANPTIQKFKAALDKNGDNLLDIEQELKSIQQKQLDAFPNVPGFGASGATFLEDWQKNGSVTSMLPAFKKPVLLLNGEGDIQTVVQGAREVDAALEKAGNPDHKLITYPGLGHTFYPVKGFSQPLGPMQEQVLKDMGDWLSQHFGRK